MSSIHDVARYSGVSTATVSRALRGLPGVAPRTRRAVQAAAAELGYVVSPTASALSSGRHRAVAVVVPSMGRWFYTEVVDGATDALRTAGYDVFLVDLGVGAGMRRRFDSTDVLRRSDAVIALGIDFSPEEQRQLRSSAQPVVAVGSPVPGVRGVGIDDALAARLALGHLTALGHRDIGHIGGEDEGGMNLAAARLRQEEWLRTMRSLGSAPRWYASAGFSMPQAAVAAERMLAVERRPTALFVDSDEMAFGALQAARDAGLDVPGDLSIVGIDDHAWSATLHLSTVRQDPREQGAVAARGLLDELAGNRSASRIQLIAPRLIVRGTTGPPG